MASEIVLDQELSFLRIVLHVTLKVMVSTLFHVSSYWTNWNASVFLLMFHLVDKRTKKKVENGVKTIYCETWRSDPNCSICWSRCLSKTEPCYEPNDDGYSSKDWSSICSNIHCAQPTSGFFGSPTCAGLACTGRGIGSKKGLRWETASLVDFGKHIPVTHLWLAARGSVRESYYMLECAEGNIIHWSGLGDNDFHYHSAIHDPDALLWMASLYTKLVRTWRSAWNGQLRAFWSL
jgi:hypothetical protein